jgi:NAD+ diphosphatase
VSTTNTFAGVVLDRRGERRADTDWIAARLADRDSRALVVSEAGPHLDGDRPALVPTAGRDLRDAVFLGMHEDRALFATEATDDIGPAGEPVGLRDAAARVSHPDAGLLAYAAAMVGWHRTHRFCANCGSASEPADAGHVRRCPNCGAQHHPRTDPVVIMLVHDDARDRVLLGRQARWPAGRYSALAGFVEPGESLEEAVAREVREESGVDVAGPLFRSSQPWPFPASLMIGFHAAYVRGEPDTRDDELEDVRWFERAELAAIARGETDLGLPPPAAIARRLIDEWLEAA